MQTKFKDLYGNSVQIRALNDGSFERVIQTNRDTKFVFMDEEYTFSQLFGASWIKDYWETSHSERQLRKDKFGRLLHYSYEEEMNFNGGRDREDYLWIFVRDEDDSDELSENSGMGLLRVPYIAADENNWVAVHEYVDENWLRIAENEFDRLGYVTCGLNALNCAAESEKESRKDTVIKQKVKNLMNLILRK